MKVNNDAFYYEFVCQSIRFRVDAGGVMGLGLIMLYLYYEFVCQSITLRVEAGGVKFPGPLLSGFGKFWV